MSDNDEIKPGDRFEAVEDWCLPMGTVLTVSGPVLTVSGPRGSYWAVRERTGSWNLGNTTLWRRLPRTEAPAVKAGSRWRWNRSGTEFVVTGLVGDSVGIKERDGLDSSGHGVVEIQRNATPMEPAVKVGDIVRDPALLAAGMTVEWATVPNDWSMTPWPWDPSELQSGYAHQLVAHIAQCGIRILVLPWPPKAEAVEPPPPCCAPEEPCLATGVCPGWKEDAELHSAGSSDCPCAQCVWFRAQRGVSADALPPARASTYQPRCAEFAGWGSWNGRSK